MAKSSTTPEETLAKLVEIQEIEDEYTLDEDILCAIAKNPSTPIYLLERLANNGNYRIREAVARNINTSSEILDSLASDRSTTVLLEVAKNPNTSASTLEQLAGENRQIRDAVVKHSNVSNTAIDLVRFIEEKSGTPVYILEKLASDRRLHVRQLVADHPFTPSHILDKLSQERDFTILDGFALPAGDRIIHHPNISSQILEELTDRLIEEYVTGQDLPKSNQSLFSKLRKDLPNNPLTPSHILRHLANESDCQIACALAENINTPIDILLNFLVDK